jgi:hypothetical protein
LLQPDIYRSFIAPLNLLGVRYCVTGSTAGIAYGEPRMTNDIDIVVELSLRDIPRFTAAFPLEHYYCPPEDTLFLEVRREQRGHCNIIEHASGFKADIYFPYDDMHEWALSMRREITIEDTLLYLAPPEYVVVRKLAYFRDGGSEKHLRDIRGILAVSKETLQHPVIERWAMRFGLLSQWDIARQPK